MMATDFQPVTTENLPGQPSILSFFGETGTTAKVVLGILLFFSFVSWVIIFAKFLRFRRVSRQSEKFVGFFRKSKRFSEVNTFAGELSDTPLTTLFRSTSPASPRSSLSLERRGLPRRSFWGSCSSSRSYRG